MHECGTILTMATKSFFIVFSVIMCGCAVGTTDVDDTTGYADSTGPDPVEVVDPPEKQNPHEGCTPVFDNHMQPIEWLCPFGQGPIEMGDDFGDDFGDVQTKEKKIPFPDPGPGPEPK
jgi:hypothetical protein